MIIIKEYGGCRDCGGYPFHKGLCALNPSGGRSVEVESLHRNEPTIVETVGDRMEARRRIDVYRRAGRNVYYISEDGAR